MDPEHTFVRVHARLSGVIARLITPKFRLALEYLSLFNAVVLLILLVVMHVNFVAQPGCAAEFSGREAAEAQLIQARITGSSRLLEGGPHYAKQLIEHHPRAAGENNGFLDADVPSKVFSSQPETTRRPLSASASDALLHYLSKWSSCFANLVKRMEQRIRTLAQVWRIAGWESFATTPKGDRRAVTWNKLDSVIVDQVEPLGKMHDPMYLYSAEKGYLILSEAAKFDHNVKTVNISISAQNSCFGNRWQRFLIDNFVGYDTIMMNSLLNSRGKGYLYNFQTKELYNLNYLQPAGVPHGFQDWIVLKFGVLIMSLFVFFTTTMSVSFTLRETQSRMLKFTLQLQNHARHQLPTFHLIFIHVFESLVFVPIMIGILFFLFEFFDDQLLAFMVLTLVWLCELFTMISVRTLGSMKYFPRFFFLYFMVFHIYFFSYTYGFSYLAFSATAAFMHHLLLFFWNRLEVPALQPYLLRRRTLFQHGLHITSSAFLTQVAGRLAGDQVPREQLTTLGGGDGNLQPGTTEARSDRDSVNSQTSSADVSTGSAAPMVPAGPITAIGSIFPWTLGTSTASVSFLPMFRDVREQEPGSASPADAVSDGNRPQPSSLRHRHLSPAEGEAAR